MIYLFLDTTALHNNWRLEGASWDSIQDAIKLDIATIATSSITVLELERQARHDAAEVSKNAERLARNLRRHGKHTDPITVEFDTAIWQAEFTDRLGERGIDVVKRANPSHDELLARDLTCTPPFKRSGAGYRDALIWSTFLDWVATLAWKEGDELYFVTDNTTQFVEGGKRHGSLDPRLQRELQDATSREAKHLADIKAVTETIRPPAKAKKQAAHPTNTDFLNSDAEAAADEEGGFLSAEDQALHYAQAQTSKLVGASLDDLYVLKESALRGYSIDGVPVPPIEEGDITAVDLTGVEDAHQSDVLDGTELWTVDLDASMEVEATLHKQDLNELPDDGTIVDPDWNRHYMLVSFPLQVRLRYDVRVDGEDVTDGQLVDVTLLSSS